MASHWKSTPSYWCKFCASYVRDTPIERKNHESSAKHQNNIQRSLRELHKTKEREDRDKQRAKDEVARLNGLVGGAKQPRTGSGNIIGARTVGNSTGPPEDAAAQRKAHAQQLAAMGVELPDELKKEITGVSEWQTLSTRVVDEGEGEAGATLADILKLESVKKESKDGMVKGVHKRFADEDEDALAGEEGRKRKAAWGSRMKTYPGEHAEEVAQEDLDALLSGVTTNKKPTLPTHDDAAPIDQASRPIKEKHPERNSAEGSSSEVKPEVGEVESGITAPPVPLFKKRKAKK